ncbi:hypothetical protein JCM21900_006111 [Sporobolomyces salmonicolor]
MPLKSERQLRREEPLPEVKLPSTARVEESLAVTQPHVAPAAAKAAKTKRAKSAASNKRKAALKEAAMERSQKLEKRKTEAGSRKELRKKAKQLWA